MRGDEEAKTGERKERKEKKFSRRGGRVELRSFPLRGNSGCSEKWGVILGGEMEACLTGFSFPPSTADRRRLTFPSNS